MRKNWKTLVITSVVILLPILLGLFLWNQLPEQLPIHWNAKGEVDGWTGKAFGVFGMPLIMLALHWLCAFATGADPKKAAHSEKVMSLVLWLIPTLTLLLVSLTYATALGAAVRVEIFINIFLGLLFTIIGNYLPKCKQNYTIGIKLPWTLNSEENWNKTHRMAGKLWMACGVVMILTSFLGLFWLFAIVALVMVLVPLIYSYGLHRKGI
ncbi:MAG: SdpI family protein [Oscillospiraceae bacterium]|nr:SdpI family protein [Oscillospiraceae bacterium]